MLRESHAAAAGDAAAGAGAGGADSPPSTIWSRDVVPSKSQTPPAAAAAAAEIPINCRAIVWCTRGRHKAHPYRCGDVPGEPCHSCVHDNGPPDDSERECSCDWGSLESHYAAEYCPCAGHGAAGAVPVPLHPPHSQI
jgi:hypothetical protein